MKIKCIVTDDEPFAREGLCDYIKEIDYLKLIGECEDAMQLNALLKVEQPDLIFLDIEMPLLSGLDYLASIQNPPKVIITSAYEKYALKGYELDVVDYLLKPIPFERFMKAVEKVYTILEKETAENSNEYIFVKSDKQLKKILLEDILLIESMENYVTIVTLSSKEIVKSTMKSLLEMLPKGCFLQVHRSYIVNIKYIQSIEGNMLHVASYEIPVARNLREQVFNIILNNRLIAK